MVDNLRVDDMEDCGRWHIAVVVKQIPEFGACIALYDLRASVKGEDE
jgi:hypothetical protein